MGGDVTVPAFPRVDRSRAEMSAFLEDLTAWRERRADDDSDQRHASQLAAVDSLLRGAASVLRGELDSVAVDLAAPSPPAPGDVYERCLALDRRIGWLQRLWKYFRDLFDQRDDPRYRPLLDAADEVVESCFRPVIAMAQLHGLTGAAPSSPLPFLEFELSPATTPATVVPRILERDASPAVLTSVLSRLPFSAVHLPAASLRSPWWLVFTAHEAGHCVQAELGLDGSFRDHVEAKMRLVASSFFAEQWAEWADEIFADSYSLLMMGPAALRGLLEFELKTPASMRRMPSSYPPSAVRLALMAALLDDLGLGGKLALSGVDPAAIVAGDKDAEAHLALVPHVVTILRGDLPGLSSAASSRVTLEDLCAFRRENFLATSPPPVDPRPELAPRRIVMEAIARWDELEREPDAAARGRGLADLAARTLRSLRATRGASEADVWPADVKGLEVSRRRRPTLTDATARGRALGAALLAARLPDEAP